VLRGTALLLDNLAAYLWMSGYVPKLDAYIGPETPNPLHIAVMRSKNAKPDIRTVLGDIMGFTKINYDSCNFNDGLPVTVRFARMVGDVLTMGSAKGEERQPFKFSYEYINPCGDLISETLGMSATSVLNTRATHERCQISRVYDRHSRSLIALLARGVQDVSKRVRWWNAAVGRRRPCKASRSIRLGAQQRSDSVAQPSVS
jgi:hypothetical protein